MPGFYSKRIGIKPQTNRYGLCAPESVDDSQDGEAGGDEDEALVLRGRPLRRDVLVLAPEKYMRNHTLETGYTVAICPRDLT